MSRVIIVLVAALGIALGYTAPADACGVKLSVKSPKVKKRVKRTSYPSHILVLGSPPSKRLTRWLKQAGHTVESTKQASGAKRKDYAIIIADPEKVDEARTNFPRSRVVTRSGTLSSNVRKIERALSDAPTPASDTPAAVASRQSTGRSTGRTRRPAATRVRRDPPQRKVEEPKKPPVVAAVEKTEPEESPEAAELTKNDEPEDTTTEPEETNPEPAEEPKPKSNARWTKEFFFGTNSNSLTSSSRNRLKGNARWLADNPSVTITIEGHTDAAGPAEYNKDLGERRAEAVRAFLVEQGIDESRIEVISYGEERPAYKTDRKNRRVAIVKN